MLTTLHTNILMTGLAELAKIKPGKSKIKPLRKSPFKVFMTGHRAEMKIRRVNTPSFGQPLEAINLTSTHLLQPALVFLFLQKLRVQFGEVAGLSFLFSAAGAPGACLSFLHLIPDETE